MVPMRKIFEVLGAKVEWFGDTESIKATTEDLEISKIYISVFNKEKQEDVLNQIKHSANFIRKKSLALATF